MTIRRFTIDLAIPEKIPETLLEKPTQAQLTALAKMTWLEIIRTMIRRLKEYSENINTGTAKEEDATRAVWHLCNHDIGLPCEPEQEI